MRAIKAEIGPQAEPTPGIGPGRSEHDGRTRQVCGIAPNRRTRATAHVCGIAPNVKKWLCHNFTVLRPIFGASRPFSINRHKNFCMDI